MLVLICAQRLPARACARHAAQECEPSACRCAWLAGIRPSDLVGAVAFEEAQRRVAELLRGRMLVGHALENDLRCLYLAHPKRSVRDTARYPPLMRQQVRASGSPVASARGSPACGSPAGLAARGSPPAACATTADPEPCPPPTQSATGRLKPRPLRQLAEEQLGLIIQEGQHCPVADARAALYIYLRHKKVGKGPGCESAHPAPCAAQRA